MTTHPVRLKELKVKNFRSFMEESFSFEKFTIVIGRNGAGKSNVLDAVEIFLSGTPKSIQDSDYWNPEQPVAIEGTIENVGSNLSLCSSEAMQKKVESMLNDGALHLRRQFGRGVEKPGALVMIAADGTDAKLPTGIDAELKRILPEPIFIRALADAADVATGKTTSPLGQLLALILAEIEKTAQPTLDKAFAEAEKLLNVVGGHDGRVKELREIEAEITSNLQEFFSGTSARLRVTLPDIKRILGDVSIDVDDGVRTPYFRKGQGVQRALYLSILRALAKVLRKGAAAAARPILLMIEEPELFLHPSSQEQMRDALGQIAESAQTLISTHSANMLSPSTLKQLTFIDKEIEGNKTLSKKRKTDLTKLSEIIEKDVLLILDLQRASRIFFHRNVLLVEGPSDVHLVGAIARVAGLGPRFLHDVAIIECGGKAKVPDVKHVLTALGIRAMALLDDDFAWDGAGSVLGSHKQLSELCQALTKHSDNSAKRKALADDSKLQTLFEAVKKDLACHDIHILSKGPIESYVGLAKSSKGKYLMRSREIVEGTTKVLHLDELKYCLSQFQNN